MTPQWVTGKAWQYSCPFTRDGDAAETGGPKPEEDRLFHYLTRIESRGSIVSPPGEPLEMFAFIDHAFDVSLHGRHNIRVPPALLVETAYFRFQQIFQPVRRPFHPRSTASEPAGKAGDDPAGEVYLCAIQAFPCVATGRRISAHYTHDHAPPRFFSISWSLYTRISMSKGFTR